MLYERNTENMNTKIDYAAIREAKQAMLQRFMQAKKQADKRAANNEPDGMYADDSEVTDLARARMKTRQRWLVGN